MADKTTKAKLTKEEKDALKKEQSQKVELTIELTKGELEALKKVGLTTYNLTDEKDIIQKLAKGFGRETVKFETKVTIVI